MADPVKITLQVADAPAAAAAIEKVGQTAQDASKSAATAATESAGAAKASTEEVAQTVVPELQRTVTALENAGVAAVQAVGKTADAISERIDSLGRRIGQVAKTTPMVPPEAKEAKPLPMVPPPRLTPDDVAKQVQAEQAAQKAALRETEQAARSTSGGIQQLTDSIFRLVGVQNPLNGQIGQTVEAAGQLASGAESAAVGIGGMAVAAIGATAAVVAIGVALFQSATGAANFADEAGKQADAVGLSVEKWTQLRYAAELNNVSAGQLSAGLRRLSEEAAKGGGAFDRMGISARNADGSVKDAGQLFGEVAEKMSGYKDGIEKITLANELFGNSSKKMMTLLNGGAEGLERAGEGLKKIGGEVTTDAAAQGDKLNNVLRELHEVGTALWYQFGIRLVPILTEFATTVLGVVQDNGTLRDSFDWLVVPLQAINRLFGEAVAKGALLGDTVTRVATAMFLAADGDFKAAKEELAGYTEDLQKYATKMAEIMAGPKRPASDSNNGSDKTQAPRGDTADEKAERERGARILAIREKSELELAQLEAKARKAANDDDYKNGRISLDAFYEAKRKAIQDDYNFQIAEARIAAEQEKDFGLAGIQFQAAKAKATETLRHAEDQLGRERVNAIAHEIDETQKLNAEQLKQFQADEKKNAATQLRIGVRQAELGVEEAANRLREVEGDQTLGIAEKRERVGKAIQAEISLIPALIAALEAQKAAADPEHALEIQAKITREIEKQIELVNRLAKLKPTGFVDQLSERFKDLQKHWSDFSGNMVNAIAGPIANGMNNLGDSVLDIASGMKTAGEVGLGMARQLASGMITAIGQMVVARTVAFLTGQTEKKEEIATTAAGLPVKAADAAATAGGSWGLSAVIGLAAFAALMAAAMAFETGGPIPGGEKLIRVNERGQETVVNAAGTARWAGLLDAINHGATSAAQLQPHIGAPDQSARVNHQAALAAVTGRAAGAAMPAVNVTAPPTTVVAFDSERAAHAYMNTRAGRNAVLKIVGTGRGQLGLERG